MDTYYILPVGDKVILKNLLTDSICEIPIIEYNYFVEKNAIGELIEQIDNVLPFKSLQIEAEHECLSIFIVTTMTCNLTCSYCFENGKNRDMSLSCNQDTQKILNYIQFKLMKNSYKNIDICFTGGEPLFNSNFIEEICELLPSITSLPIHYSLITNGTIFTTKIMEMLNNYYFSIQISFDGDEYYHNLERKNRLGRGTYQRILRNTDRILKDYKNIFIQARINISARNCNSIYNLIKDLSKFRNNRQFILYFAFVAVPIQSELFLKTKEKVAIIKEILFLLVQKDIPHVKDIEAAGYCMFKNNHAFTIHSDGDIYKCYSLVGDSEFSISNINRLNDNIDGVGSLCENKQCAYYEICYGGCPYNTFIQDGQLSIDCEYPVLDIVHKIKFLAEVTKDLTDNQMEELIQRIQTVRHDTDNHSYYFIGGEHEEVSCL